MGKAGKENLVNKGSILNELETKMATILDELGQEFTPQYAVGEEYFPPYCRSKFDNCEYREAYDWDDNEPECRCDGDRGGFELCEWYKPSYSYLLYILDFVLFIGQHKICIECDGFEWHHAYEWQERNDTERDKYLKDKGWIVKRFAGITITSHRGRIKKELKELFETLHPDCGIQKSLI
jgi:hypothetical protein